MFVERRKDGTVRISKPLSNSMHLLQLSTSEVMLMMEDGFTSFYFSTPSGVVPEDTGIPTYR
jgi:hypothetical protein